MHLLIMILMMEIMRKESKLIPEERGRAGVAGLRDSSGIHKTIA